MTTNNILYVGFTQAPVYADAAALTAVDTAALSLYAGYRAVVTGAAVYELIPNDTNVADGTTYIQATPNGNWVLDTTPYVCLDSNNAIASWQLGGLQDLANGTAAAPSLAFSSNNTTGMYLVGTNDIGFSTNGVLRLDISTTAVTSTLPILMATAQLYSFVGDATTGFGRGSAGTLILTCATTAAAIVTATTFSLINNSVYRVGANQVVGARQTGWTTSSGTATKNQSALNVDTITATDANLRLIGQWLKGVTDGLITHGLIGT